MFGRTREAPEDMRMHYSAPSFSLKRGVTIHAETHEEARCALSGYRDAVVLFHPGVPALSSPAVWTSLLSGERFMILLTAAEDRYVRELGKALDRVVMSPVVKRLEGWAAAHSVSEADAILRCLMQERVTDVVTINNTEVEI